MYLQFFVNVNQYSTAQTLAGNLQSILAMNQRDRSKPFTLVDNTYAYDANGNRTSKQTLAGLTTYHYDATERLVKVDYPTGSEEYRYDKAGNRTEKLLNGITTERYQYDVRNRLVSQDIISLRAAGTNEHKEYTYDEQGNMLSDGTRNFAYDAMNRLSQVTTTEGNIQKNRYDGEGLRTEMEENGRLVNFLFDGEKVVAETDGDQNVIRYIRGYDLISSDSEKAKTYYHYASDEMGSITHVIDKAGNVCNHYEYDAFGDFTVKEETVQNRFGFTGEQYDPVAGLYYLRARFYNPVIGRFIQEDTYYGDGLNLYAYCANNPVKYVDPSGHDACLQKQEAINKLTENGFSPEDAEKYYNHLRKSNGVDATLEQINKKFADKSESDSLLKTQKDVEMPNLPEGSQWERNVLNSFAGGKSTSVTYQGGTTLYRVGGNNGGFWSLDAPPATEYQWRVDFAIKQEFCNDASTLYKMTIPEGSTLSGLEGTVGSQGMGLYGGAHQVYIDYKSVPSDWIEILPMSWK